MHEKRKKKRVHGVSHSDPNFVFESYPDEMTHVQGIAIPLVAKGKDFVFEDEVKLGPYRRDYQWVFTGTLAMYDSPMLLAELTELLKKLNKNEEDTRETVLYKIELVFKKIREKKGGYKSSDQAALNNVPTTFDQYVNTHQNETSEKLLEKCIALVKNCAKETLLATTERDKIGSVDILLNDGKPITLTPGAQIADHFPEKYKHFGALFEVYSNQQYFQNIRQGISPFESPFLPTQFGPKASSRVQLIIPQRGDEQCAYYQSKWYIGSVVPTGVESYGRRLHAGVVSTLLRVSVGEDDEHKTFDDLNKFNVDLAFTERMTTDPHDLALFEHQLLTDRFNHIVHGENVELKNESTAIARFKEKFFDRKNYPEREFALVQYLKHLQDLAKTLPSEDNEPNAPLFREMVPTWQAETLLLLAYDDAAFANKLFGPYDEQSFYLSHLNFLMVMLKHPNLSAFLDKMQEQHFSLRSNLEYLKEAVDALKNKQWQVIANGLHDKEHANARRGFILAVLRSIETPADAEAALNNVMLREALDHKTLQRLVFVSGAKKAMLDHIERPTFMQRFKDNVHRNSEAKNPEPYGVFQTILHNKKILQYGDLLSEIFKDDADQFAQTVQFNNDCKLLSGDAFLAFVKNNPDRAQIVMHAMKSDKKSHMAVLEQTLEDQDARNVLQGDTIHYFYHLAPAEVEKAFKADRKFKKRYDQWCKQKREPFSINDRVQHLLVNPELWESVFSEKNKLAYRDQLNANRLFDLIMGDPRHSEIIFRDDKLRVKLWGLTASKRIVLMKKMHVAPDDETEAYSGLLSNVFDMGSDDELEDYFKFYFGTLLGRHAQGPKQGELKYPEQLAAELSNVLDPEHLCQQKEVAHLLLRKIVISQASDVKEIFKQFVLDYVGNVDLSTLIFKKVDASLRNKLISCILDDTKLVVDLRDKAFNFALAFFSHCLYNFVETGDYRSMGLNEKQLANFFKLVSEEYLLEYFGKQGKANQLAEMMIQDNQFFHLFDHFRGDKESPHRLIQVFIRNLDDKHRRVLQYSLSRIHLTYQEQDVAKNNANVTDQIKELKSVVSNLKKVSLKALKERESIKHELELLDKKRLAVWGAIERERLNVAKVKKTIIEQHNQTYEELNRDIEVLKIKISDKGKEIKAVKLDPFVQSNGNNHEEATVDRHLILEFLAAIKNFFADLFARWFRVEDNRGKEEESELDAVKDQQSIDLVFSELSESLRYLYRPNMTPEEAVERFKHTFSLLDEAKLVKQNILSVADTMPVKISDECKHALKLAKARAKKTNYSREVADLMVSEKYRDELCLHFMTNSKMKTSFFSSGLLASPSVLKMIEAFKVSDNAQLPKIIEVLINHAINNKKILSLVNNDPQLLEEILQTDGIDSQMLLELIILLDKKSTIKATVWHPFLDKQFEANREFIFDRLHFMIFKNHIKGFEEWVFSKYVAGELNQKNKENKEDKGKEEEGEAKSVDFEIRPEIIKIIRACAFKPEDYVSALYQNDHLYGDEMQGDVAVKRHIIAHLSESELIDLICHEHNELKQGQRKLYDLLSSYPVIDSIIQFASTANLMQLAELKDENANPFAAKIAEHFVKNVDVRRTVVSLDDNRLLQLLLDNASDKDYVKMVLLSTDVMESLLENNDLVSTERFVEHATTNQFVDLASHEELGSHILANEIANVDTIKDILNGDTSQTKVRRILPVLLQSESRDISEFLYEFMFDTNEAKFTPHFLELLENATAKELYDIFAACRENSFDEHEKILQHFIGAVYLGVRSDDAECYTQLIDNMLMHCTEKQVFELLIHEHANHEFVCERIIALCVEDNTDANPKLVDRIKKVLGREAIDSVSISQDIKHFLAEVKQTVTARIIGLFNENQLGIALDDLEENQVNRGEAVPWQYLKEYGQLMNDDGETLEELKKPENRNKAIDLLNAVDETAEGNLHFDGHHPVGDDKSNKAFNEALKELRIHYVANDVGYFLHYITRFEIQADDTKNKGYQFKYVNAAEDDLSELDKRLVGEARITMGQEKFWKALLIDSGTKYKGLWEGLIRYSDKAERSKPVLDLMIEIYLNYHNDFYLYFVNGLYDVIKAGDNQYELVYSNEKGALTPSHAKRIRSVIKKREELIKSGDKSVEPVAELHQRVYNTKESKSKVKESKGGEGRLKNPDVKKRLSFTETIGDEKAGGNNNNNNNIPLVGDKTPVPPVKN